MHPLDHLIDELASRQYGSLGIEQLRDGGATRAALRHRLETGRLRRGPYPRTFRHPAFDVSWQGRLWAVQLWAGPPGAVSHEAAGALYGLDGCREGAVAVTLPKGIRNRHPSVPMHETTLGLAWVRVRDGLRLTSPEETVVALAASLKRGDADDAMHCAVRRGLTTVDRINGVLDGRPGTVVARDLLKDLIGRRPRDSQFEGRFIRRARRHGLNLVAQFEVRVDGHQYFIDFADPLRRIAIELDGFETHATREQFQRDATRSTLLQLNGWRVLHFTWADVRDRPDWVLDCIRRAIAA